MSTEQPKYDKTAIKRLVRLKAWGQSRKMARAALRKSPRDAWLLDNVAYTLYRQDRDREALQVLRQCRRLFPHDVKFMSNMACVLWYLDEDQAARKMCLRILAVRPGRRATGCKPRELRLIRNDARGMLGTIYRDMHRSLIARKWFTEFIKHHRPSDNGFITLAEAKREVSLAELRDSIYASWDKGDWRLAKKLIDRYLKRNPGSFYFLAERGYACMKLGRLGEGLRSVQKANKVIKENNVIRCEPLGLWYEARILDKLGRHKKAERLYRQILRLSEKEIGLILTKEGLAWARAVKNDCRLRLGMNLANQGRDASARKWIREHISRRRHVIWNNFPMSTVKAVLNDTNSK
jgi:tetratricopeptide (TPR) repeat protein